MSLLVDRLEELSNLRIQLVTQQLDNPLRVQSVRRDIARIKTVLSERALNPKRPQQVPPVANPMDRKEIDLWRKPTRAAVARPLWVGC